MPRLTTALPSPHEVDIALARLREEPSLPVPPSIDRTARAAIWQAMRRAWRAVTPETRHDLSPGSRQVTVCRVPAAQSWALPLNVAGYGVVAHLCQGASPRCRVEIVGRGSFIYGDDNAVFGRWDSLVAVDRTGRLISLFAGHGGEIIPGRLADHVDRLREYVRTGVARPVQLDIDPTMACPSACTFCFSAGYRSSRRTGLHLRGQLLSELVDGWADRGVRVVRFDGGGDPLAHPQLLAAIDTARRRGLRTAVLTAADLLRQVHLEPLLAARTYLRVSLNAGDDATRLAIHRPRNQRLTLTEPLRIVRRLADQRAERYGPAGPALMPIGATSMLVPENADGAYAIAQQAKRAGFDHLSFRVVLGAQHAVRFSAAARKKLAAQVAQARADLADDGFQIFTPTRPLTDQGYRPSTYFDTCLACTHRVLVEVGPDQDTAAVVPCGRYRGHGFQWSPQRAQQRVFGLLASAADIDRVWHSPTMTELVERFPAACGDCIDRSANVMFNAIVGALRSDAEARFFRFRATGRK